MTEVVFFCSEVFVRDFITTQIEIWQREVTWSAIGNYRYSLGLDQREACRNSTQGRLIDHHSNRGRLDGS